MSQLEKYKTLARAVQDVAGAIGKTIKEGYPTKRIFRKIDRTPGKRIRKKQAQAVLPIVVFMGLVNIMRLKATPVLRPGTREIADPWIGRIRFTGSEVPKEFLK